MFDIYEMPASQTQFFNPAFIIIFGFILALGSFAMWLLARGVGIKT